MNDYFRIFRYGTNLGFYLPVFMVFTLLGIVFSAFNLALLIPLLDILFDKVDPEKVVVVPANHLSIEYFLWLFKSGFTSLINEEGKKYALLYVCVIIAFSVLFSNLFRYLANLISARIQTDILKTLRMDIFKKVTSLHIGYFTNERRGDLISRITNDVNEVHYSILGSFRTLFKEPLTVIIYFISLFIISFKLTLFTIIILPIAGGLMAEIIKRLKVQAIQSQESLGRIVNIFDETIGGMRVVKAFNARAYTLGKMDKETGFFRRVGFSMARKRELASPMSEFLGVGIVIGILYYGGTLILNNEGALEASAFISYLAFFSQIISPAKAFSNGITNLQRGLASATRIFEVVDTPPAIVNAPSPVKMEKFDKVVEFKKVGFIYDKEPVLHNIDFRLHRGKTIALVGPSGGGKSTLADLLPRFYDTCAGEILIDGISIREYDIESLRSHMGIVTQESILFNDTVMNNIAFGIESPDESAVIRAAKIANAHDFIMEMEDGYQSNIGERGNRLSGGQRQRLSIARAVLKDPDILILDEATSALDSESERLVQDALTRLMENRTSLVIAHRLSTIRHADEILVIEKGEIKEKGTHEELLALGGLYKKLSQMQNIFIDSTQTDPLKDTPSI
ncbi:MAG: ABC transporter ATP-binding protein/permease [Cyclobacteriaceae bacterium]|nr:ABC transporter ATP-binding protein/permease [Cyclobacteriaceae bacterium]